MYEVYANNAYIETADDGVHVATHATHVACLPSRTVIGLLARTGRSTGLKH